jgi:four helix bundle protein
VESQNFRSLKVWQLGMQLVEEVYRLSQQFPKQEMYGLTSQAQRAAVSIPANIAEGHAMGSTKEFLRFLAIAQGSVAELETHLLLAQRLKYGGSTQIGPILGRCSEEARMLRSLRKRLRIRLEH